MAADKLVDSTQLDSDLTSVANAIRTKGGTSASLAFPAGFVSAIGNIPTGGGVSKKYIIKDGVIQSGYTAQTVSPAMITEESGGYVHLSVTGNEWCTGFFNGVDFTDYAFLIVEFYSVSDVCGWSWNSFNAHVPAISVGNGNAAQNEKRSSGGFDALYVSGTEGDIKENYAIIRIESLTVGNVKMSVSAKSGHPSAYLDIKNLYLVGE